MIARTLPRAGGADPGAMSPPRRRAAEPAIPGLRPLARRLETLGYAVVGLETRRGERALLVDRGAAARAAILPSALADRTDDGLEHLAQTVRELAPDRPLVALAFGEANDNAVRGRLRDAGIELALRDPLDPHVLRFQMNRALAAGPLPERVARRAPLGHDVSVRRHLLSRSIPVYTLSSRGAFLLADRPLAPGRRLSLDLPVGRLQARARARVVMANPARARIDRALPPGMAVAFEDLDGPSAAVINRLVDERLAGLAV